MTEQRFDLVVRNGTIVTPAVAAAVGLAAGTGSAVYIVHLSSAAALDRCRQARAVGLPVYVETRRCTCT